MEISNVVAYSTYGSIDLIDDGARISITLTEAECTRIHMLVHEIVQARNLVLRTSDVKPPAQLCDFTEVEADDIPF